MEMSLYRRIASLSLEQRQQLLKRLNLNRDTHDKQESHDSYLCAFIAGQPGEDVDETELRRYLTERLPAYMIPSYFMILPEFPLTRHGKVDLKALRGLDSSMAAPGAGSKYTSPQNSVQELMVELWKDVLNLEKVGIDDSFFEIGGNSLKLLRLNNRLKEAFNREIPIMEMFEHPTIRSLSAYVGKDQPLVEVNEVRGTGNYPEDINKAKQNKMRQREKRTRKGT